MPKLDDRWIPGLWLGKSLASDEHCEGTSAGVWSEKVLNEMIGDHGNSTPQPKEKLQEETSLWIVRSSMEARRDVQHVTGMRMCVHQNAEARFQDIVDNEAPQTGVASPADETSSGWLRAQFKQRPSSGCGWTRARM